MKGLTMENLFIYKNLIPTKQHVMLADSFLNALIAFSHELSWKDGVNLLYSRAAQLAIRPYDDGVVNSILDDLGLTRITKPDTLAELKRLLADDKVAFGRIGMGKDHARMVVFISQGDTLLSISDTNPFPFRVNTFWIGNKELVRQRIRELNETARRRHADETKLTVMESEQDKNTQYFHYFQPNPEAYNIGDCVVRAFCAVTGESWGSIMRQLAVSLDGRNLDFNYDNNFLNLLLEKGFGRVSPIPKLDGRLMTGMEVCDWMKQKYPNGDGKAFAFVGHSHVAGILPDQKKNGETRYRFHDSWDSTSRKITELFIKVDELVIPTEAPRKKPTSIDLGMYIRHPQYGIGQVSGVAPYRDDALVTVQFDIGAKNILKSWALKHCYQQ